MTGVDSEIDLTNGWVDPRILGGRLLDVSKYGHFQTSQYSLTPS